MPEVLVAVASHRAGATLAELAAQLNLPKSSLHRLLHTLVQGQYLSLNAGLFALGPESYRLASSIGQSTSPADFRKQLLSDRERWAKLIVDRKINLE